MKLRGSVDGIDDAAAPGWRRLLASVAFFSDDVIVGSLIADSRPDGLLDFGIGVRGTERTYCALPTSCPVSVVSTFTVLFACCIRSSSCA